MHLLFNVNGNCTGTPTPGPTSTATPTPTSAPQRQHQTGRVHQRSRNPAPKRSRLGLSRARRVEQDFTPTTVTGERSTWRRSSARLTTTTSHPSNMALKPPTRRPPINRSLCVSTPRTGHRYQAESIPRSRRQQLMWPIRPQLRLTVPITATVPAGTGELIMEVNSPDGLGL